MCELFNYLTYFIKASAANTASQRHQFGDDLPRRAAPQETRQLQRPARLLRRRDRTSSFAAATTTTTEAQKERTVPGTGACCQRSAPVAKVLPVAALLPCLFTRNAQHSTKPDATAAAPRHGLELQHAR